MNYQDQDHSLAGSYRHLPARQRERVPSAAAPPSSAGHAAIVVSPTLRDVLNGRGMGVQRHPGNVKYRMLVFVNKGIYVKCRNSDKVKVSKGIVAAVRELGGRFLQLDERTRTYRDIGDKKAVDKTSQALREGLSKIRREVLCGGDADDDEKNDGSKPAFDASMMEGSDARRGISAEGYFGYSVQVLQSLYDADEDGAAEDVRVEPPKPATMAPPPKPVLAPPKPVLPRRRASEIPSSAGPAPAGRLTQKQLALTRAATDPALDEAYAEARMEFCSRGRSMAMAMALDQFPTAAQNAAVMKPTAARNASVQNAVMQNAVMQNAVMQNAAMQNAVMQNAAMQNTVMQPVMSSMPSLSSMSLSSNHQGQFQWQPAMSSMSSPAAPQSQFQSALQQGPLPFAPNMQTAAPQFQFPAMQPAASGPPPLQVHFQSALQQRMSSGQSSPDPDANAAAPAPPRTQHQQPPVARQTQSFAVPTCHRTRRKSITSISSDSVRRMLESTRASGGGNMHESSRSLESVTTEVFDLMRMSESQLKQVERSMAGEEERGTARSGGADEDHEDREVILPSASSERVEDRVSELRFSDASKGRLHARASDFSEATSYSKTSLMDESMLTIPTDDMSFHEGGYHRSSIMGRDTIVAGDMVSAEELLQGLNEDGSL